MAVYRVMDRIEFGRFFMRFVAPPRAVILAYHKICPLENINSFARDLAVGPEAFEEQVAYLKKHYDIVSLEQLRRAIEKKSKDTGRMAVITFDDAYRDNYAHAFQVLRKYKLTATIFVPTAFIESGSVFWWDRLAFLLGQAKKRYFFLKFKDKKYGFSLKDYKAVKKTYCALSHLLKYSKETEKTELLGLLSGILQCGGGLQQSETLTWEQMQEMSREGIVFGAHTHTHLPLSLLESAELRGELCQPREILETRLGMKISVFAYPYGERGDFTPSSVDAVAKAGYAAAVTMVQGRVSNGDSPLLLPRIGIGGFDTARIFRLKLSGLMPLFQH